MVPMSLTLFPEYEVKSAAPKVRTMGIFLKGAVEKPAFRLTPLHSRMAFVEGKNS